MTVGALVLAGAVQTILAVPAAARNDLTDPQIARVAYTAGNIEIDTAKQALERSKSTDVRAFAEQMIRDHHAVNTKALALVKKLSVTPEANPVSTSLTTQAQATAKRLNSLRRSAFDRAYAEN